ncbi:uncharacterized protein LOC144058112 [Vanacampus margaritifer]
MAHRLGPLLLLLAIPSVVPLFCYTCVFPAISPLDCIRFPLMCPAGQVCLSSKVVGQKGAFHVVIYEKSCILPALCGVSGQKSIMGLNFTFTNKCCDTHLCNRAAATATPIVSATCWSATLLALFVSSLNS